jgi:dihydroorotase
VSLVHLIGAVTLRPAQLLGLDAGRLSPGSVADLVLCDTGAPVAVDSDRLISKSKNSPFDGRRLQGKVLLTMVGGRVVYRAD